MCNEHSARIFPYNLVTGNVKAEHRKLSRPVLPLSYQGHDLDDPSVLQ